MKCYQVGGWVRDQLLGLSPQDCDWVVVGATAACMEEQGFIALDQTFPVYLHPQSGEEYALARTETKIATGHKGFRIYAGPDVSLEQDLMRRDLTINAIAQSDTGVLIDPFGGRQDIENGCLRHISPAFVEDPLRLLRVARFCARFAHVNFALCQDTGALLKEMTKAGELVTLAGPRVFKEMRQALGEATPSVFFQVLQRCGALAQLLPEIKRLPDISFCLDQAAQGQAGARLLFALLTLGIGNVESSYAEEDQLSEIKSLCARLGVSIGQRELTLAFAQFRTRWRAWDGQDPAIAMDLLVSQDAFRKPARFLEVLELVALTLPETWQGKKTGQWASLSKLRVALAKIGEIQTNPFIALGLRGKEIGIALRKKRLEILREAL